MVRYEYMYVKLKLMEEITAGKYPVGARLPTERALCDVFHVSRITIRQSLAELEKEGLIVRRQGKGTFVQKPNKYEQALSYNYSFSEELRKQNVVPGTRVLALKRIPAQAPLTECLQVEEGHDVAVLVRLRLADGMPYAHETSYIPAEYLGDADADAIARDGLYNTMERNSGVRPNHAVEVFEAAIASEAVTQALERKGPLSVMRIERSAYLNDRIVEYCTSAVAGDKYRFRVSLKTS